MPILDKLSGYKTYIAAVGMVGLAVYQLSQGDFAGAWQSVGLAGLGGGLRAAISVLLAKLEAKS